MKFVAETTLETLHLLATTIAQRHTSGHEGDTADDEHLARKSGIVASLGERGRGLLRKSGTEPLLRVMAEAETDAECEAAVDEIIDAMRTSGHLVRVK